MLLQLRQVLSAAQVALCREALGEVEWVDGRATAGYLSGPVKRNHQVPEEHPVGRRLGEMILVALEHNPVFMSAALPAKVVPPLFNRYTGEESYGRHVDGGVRPIAGSAHRVRTDLAATLFLSDPEEYDGGELVVEDNAATQRIKFPAGDMVLYPATQVHNVERVTRGVRLASFFWVQSMVREEARRRMLYGLDGTIQTLARELPQHAAIVDMMALYHNLLREWADI